MQNGALRKVAELSPDIRRAIEILIPAPSKMTRLSPSTIYKPSPTGYAQKLASEKLRARIDQTAQRALEVPDAEVEAAIDEGINHSCRSPE